MARKTGRSSVPDILNFGNFSTPKGNFLPIIIILATDCGVEGRMVIMVSVVNRVLRLVPVIGRLRPIGTNDDR